MVTDRKRGAPKAKQTRTAKAPDKYFPFIDRKHMLRAALQDAIAWEESRVEAGCDMGDPVALGETMQRVKAYRRELKRIAPEAKSYFDIVGEELGKYPEGAFLTLPGIKKRVRTSENRAKGGHARAKKLSAKRRKEIAQNAARKRWERNGRK